MFSSSCSQTRRRALLLAGALSLAGAGIFGASFRWNAQAAPPSVQLSSASRPRYDIALKMDWSLLTFSSVAKIAVPASPGDALSDASFFLFANADGVGGASATQKNLVVDSVSVGGKDAKWTLDGPVLKVRFASPQTQTARVEVRYHGLVPRSSAESGGLGGLMGADVSGLFGMGQPNATQPKAKPKNTDYGLYTATPQIVSLGSFWSPTLAVRENGKWRDEAPDGLGDVAYAQKSDYRVSLNAPANMTVVAPGTLFRTDAGVEISADNVRDCAILASREFKSKSKIVLIGGKPVEVSAYATKAHADRLDECLDISARALQIFSKRFGAYPFPEFRVVEAPMRSGAGGMEYSRMIGISSSLYEPMGKQLGGLVSSLGLPGADQLLEGLGDEGGGVTAPDAGGANDLIGGLLGQQKGMLDSMLETTLAHEVAHQWWAIGVGSDSQRDPWVDEALTNWSAMLYFDDRYGKEKGEQMRDLHLKTSFSMGAALSGGDRPANLPSGAYASNLQYGAVVYGKAALFYDRLRELVGDAAFFAALRDYYARHNDGLAGPDTLRALVVSHAPNKKSQIEALYKRWIEEAHGSEDIGAGAMGDLTQMLGGLLGGGAGLEE